MKRQTLSNVYKSLETTRQLLLNAMVEIDDCIEDNDDAPEFELTHINKKIHNTICEMTNHEDGYEKLYHVSAPVLLQRDQDES